MNIYDTLAVTRPLAFLISCLTFMLGSWLQIEYIKLMWVLVFWTGYWCCNLDVQRIERTKE